ncbi:N-acyl homoserine lactonase family protein [Flavobacterium sp. CLA17]|uniref:N-acyl homoserine lactonase family protein n=1 Tax=Flavobacterium sp. CLA17 TaxID=2724135 RepID=UPI0014929429|nr:N-acyl homoserine lactonase family protein [Flavobacterium sp. CLA17]QSB28780.1 N-acyl homoserine lactonase family protein [Flavobacterium sp. CLA17]
MRISLLSVFLFIINYGTLFSQTPNYEVYALKFASIEKLLPLAVNVIDAPENETVDPAFIFWLIRDPKGKNILIDAGFLNDIPQVKDFGITKYVQPDKMLAGLHLKAEDITDIILTHPHWDHMGGIALFPNAQVWIQKEDYNYFVGNAWQQEGHNGGFNKEDVRKLTERNLAGKLMLINGDNQEIMPGITVFTGSQHTFDSQYVLIKSNTDKIIIASDNVFTYYNLEHLKSAPAHATFNTEAYVKAMVRMKTLVSDIKFIIPGHDNLLFSKFPKITERIIKIK